MMTLSNREAANVLFNIATILELAEDNPYRIRAYRSAARRLLRLRFNAQDFVNADRELALRGLGPSLRRKLGELYGTGKMGFYVELCAELPESMQRLMTVPGVGPKTALRLEHELGVSTVRQLRDAARAGAIRQLHGFGVRREAQLQEAADQVLRQRPALRLVDSREDDGPEGPTPMTNIVRPRQLDFVDANAARGLKEAA